jgi:hypothetical protein
VTYTLPNGTVLKVKNGVLTYVSTEENGALDATCTNIRTANFFWPARSNAA